MPDVPEMALRRCPACDRCYIEDDRMYLDVNRCPFCGAMASDPPPESFAPTYGV